MTEAQTRQRLFDSALQTLVLDEGPNGALGLCEALRFSELPPVNGRFLLILFCTEHAPHPGGNRPPDLRSALEEALTRPDGPACRSVFPSAYGFLALLEERETMEDEEFLNAALRLTMSAVGQAGNETGQTLRAFLSDVHDGGESLRRVFRETELTRDYCEQSSHRAMTYRDVNWREQAPDAARLSALERQFLGQILTRQFPEAERTLGELFEQQIRNDRASVSYMKEALFFRLQNVQNLVGLTTSPDEDPIPGLTALYKQIQDALTFQELRDRIADFFALLGGAEQPREDAARRVEEICAYIREHFRNPNLDATSICRALGFSTSYLSRIYRQEKGQGFLDYVHELRIAEACKLLEQTQDNLDEIAEKTGYSNRWTLGRVFKLRQGTTPAAFRAARQTGQKITHETK